MVRHEQHFPTIILIFMISVGHPQPPPLFRQTGIGIMSRSAPAVGLAKRAVEKMGGEWGGIGSSEDFKTSF
jgi:hypothetical protein